MEVKRIKSSVIRFAEEVPERFYYKKGILDAKRISKDIQSDFLIFTIAFNNAKVIEYQINTLQEYCKSDFQYCVFDNSNDEKKRLEIQKVCNKSGIAYLSLPKQPGKLTPSASHGAAINYVIRNVIMKANSVTEVLLLDHDIFPYQPFTVESLSKGQKIYGMVEALGEGKYLWPGFFYFQKSVIDLRLMDFKPGYGGDTGSGNKKMLYDNLDFNKMQFASLKRPNIIEGHSTEFDRQKNGVDILDDTWIHYIGASDWMGIKSFDEKFKIFLDYVDKIKNEI